MITRYTLGPRITVIGRERVKQGLKSSVAAKCAFSPGGRTKGPRGRDRGFHGFVRRQQRGRRVCPAARPPPRRGHAVPQTGSLSRARCRLSRQRAGPLGRHELRGGPAKVKLLPRVRQQGARPGGRGPGGRQRAVACPVPAPESEGRCASRTRPPPGCPRRPGRTPGREVSGHERRLVRGRAWPVRGGRACRAAVRGRPPGTVTAACSRGRGRSVPRRPAGVHVKTRFPHLDGNKADF